MKITISPASPDEGGRPEFFRLPRSGQKDPYFGLSRSWYYNAEKKGLITLKRIRNRGCVRGVTLISYDQVRRLLSEQNVRHTRKFNQSREK